MRAIKLIEKRPRRKGEEEMEKLIVVDFSALLCVRIIQIKVLVEKSYQQPSINSILHEKRKHFSVDWQIRTQQEAILLQLSTCTTRIDNLKKL